MSNRAMYISLVLLGVAAIILIIVGIALGGQVKQTCGLDSLTGQYRCVNQ